MFSELSEKELNRLFVMDKYGVENSHFTVYGYDIEVKETIENLAHKLDVFQESVRLGLTEGTTTCVTYDKSTANSTVLINEIALYSCGGDAQKRLVKGK